MITEESKIKDLEPNKEFTGVQCYTASGDKMIVSIVFKDKEKTPEQLAGELGYKIDDKVFFIRDKRNYGKILSFLYTDDFGLQAITDNMEDSSSIILSNNKVTNKVAIHCHTKEEFEFINKLEGINKNEEYNSHNCYCLINDVMYQWNGFIKYKMESYLILSVDQYCQTMGMKPLFVTKDGKNIYDKDIQSWFCVNKLDIEYGVYIGGKNRNINKYNDLNLSDKKILRFSTNQSAKDWIENNKILFYTEDFKDGSFPVKSCNNCTYNKNGNIDMANCHQSCTNANPKWQGELKGEPIRKGDKCWYVSKDTCQYKEFNGDSEIAKYFSNETNARNYYNKLVEESKPKFEVGKWYVYTYGDIALYSNSDYHSGFNKEGKWINDYYPITTKYWQPADINTVEKLLYNEAKRRYPIYCKVRDLTFSNIEQIMSYNEKGAIKDGWFGIEIWFINTDGNGTKVYDNGKWTEIIEEQPTKTCKSCLFELHNKIEIEQKQCISCNLNKIYTSNKVCNWQSKQDLSNTKIWIGDNPRLSILAQEKMFKLGYSWILGKVYRDYYGNDEEWMFFKDSVDRSGMKYHNKAIQITSQDLDINEKDYYIRLITEDKVKIYLNDKFWVYNPQLNKIDELIMLDKFRIINNNKYFSTKEATEKYSMMCRPLLTISEDRIKCYNGDTVIIVFKNSFNTILSDTIILNKYYADHFNLKDIKIFVNKVNANDYMKELQTLEYNKKLKQLKFKYNII